MGEGYVGQPGCGLRAENVDADEVRLVAGGRTPYAGRVPLLTPRRDESLSEKRCRVFVPGPDVEVTCPATGQSDICRRNALGPCLSGSHEAASNALTTSGLTDHDFFNPCDWAIREKGSVVARHQIAHNRGSVSFRNEEQRVRSFEQLCQGSLEGRPLGFIRKGKVPYEQPDLIRVARLGWTNLDAL